MSNDKKILIFAGTYEGRKLCEYCSNHNISAHVCVATEYGEQTISHIDGIKILNGRLTQSEIKDLINKEKYELVIDATHPYAVVVTQNIQKTCNDLKCKYIRLLRLEGQIENENIITVPSIDKAIEILNTNNDNVLITTGSKELFKYEYINDFKNRLFVRVLPSHDALQACEKLGLPSKNIICMQGPFTQEMNIATLKQFNCKYLITKNTGTPGGFYDKINCTSYAKVIIINRPIKEIGFTLHEIYNYLEEQYAK